MESIETERLTLRPVTLDDLSGLAAQWASVEVMRFIGSGEPRSTAETRDQLAYMVGHWQDQGFGTYAIIHKGTGRFIGCCLLQYLHVTPGGVTPERLIHEVEIGYHLESAFWGPGYTKEAARAVLRHAFVDLQLPRVVAAIDGRNQASRRVLEGLGMREVEGAWFYGDCPHFIIERGEYLAQ